VTSHELLVVHRTDYEYDEVVNESHGRAHLMPRDEPGQRVLSRDVVITPAPDENHHHLDYFGNVSTYFRLSEPHQELSVTSTSHIQVDRDAADWDALDVFALSEVGEVLAREYLIASPLVPHLPEIASYASDLLVPGAPAGSALRELLARIHRDFTYKAGVTTVSTPLSELMVGRTGVCQDFAHLMIGCLRAAGLPARYVSGYLQTMPPPDKPRLVGADASHAWVSVLVAGYGWLDLDPTNDQQADHRYVVAARGRDYSDVPPLKGVIFTRSSKSTMKVSVDVQPL
jgi:transglutaminase-like putative cysteine protease